VCEGPTDVQAEHSCGRRAHRPSAAAAPVVGEPSGPCKLGVKTVLCMAACFGTTHSTQDLASTQHSQQPLRAT
jgi:hypothetical protein